MKTVPWFTHDCENCQFLGHVVVDGDSVDIYVHERDKREYSELIYRKSDEPADYGCSPVCSVTPLSVCASLALAMYVRHLGANGANSLVKGTFFKDSELVLKIE